MDEIIRLLRENNEMLKEILAFVRLQKDPEYIESQNIEDFCRGVLANLEAKKIERKLDL